MQFLKTPVRQYRYDALCDKCEGGVFTYTGQNTHSMHPMMHHLGPNKYVHECNQCKTKKMAPEIWPKVVFEDDGTPQLIDFPQHPQSGDSPTG